MAYTPFKLPKLLLLLLPYWQAIQTTLMHRCRIRKQIPPHWTAGRRIMTAILL
jgi:hypothetical protein